MSQSSFYMEGGVGMRIRAAIVIVTISIGVAFVVHERQQPPDLRIEDALVTLGDVVEIVKATGPLAPLEQVDVGAQVTGRIQKLDADFNSIVSKGEPLAEIDPEPFQTALKSAEAERLVGTDALDADEATLALDQQEAERVARLVAAEEETVEDGEAAQAAVASVRLKVQQDRAGIASADADITAARDRLARCRIVSPVNGVVISRDVEVGQTINAATAAPTLYELATDLHTLQVAAAVDEADVARVAPGEPVVVTVDAYPAQNFPAEIRKVQLDAATVNNVVTYPTVIAVRNPSLRLLPGMTASVTITTNAARDSLRVPLAALQFRAAGAVAAGPRTVWVRSGRDLIPKRVIVGVMDGRFAAITPAPGETLNEGDRVVTRRKL